MPQTRLDTVIGRAAGHIRSRQQQDGSFSYCCEVFPLSDAMMVVFLYLVKRPDDALIPALCQRLLRTQGRDGGWRAYRDQPDNVSATSLALFALRLWQSDKQTPPTTQKAMDEAATYIKGQGGITRVSNLTKVILATAGQIPWSTLPEVPISSLVYSTISPVSIYDFASFTRVHIPSIMILSHLQFRNRPQAADLRDLVIAPVRRDFPPARKGQALSDCVRYLLGHMEPDGTLAGYLTATTFAVYALQAMGYATSHPVIVRAIEGLRKLTYRGKNFVHQQVFSSTIWDTALCTQALAESRVRGWQQAAVKSTGFLADKQHRRLSDWTVHTPNTRPGGWGFSRVNSRFPDVDDTTAVLTAIDRLPKAAAEELASARRSGLAWLLAMQNDDGGWSAFDRNCNKAFLERTALNDMGRAVIDPSTPDVTGSVIEFLAKTGAAPGRVQRGAAFLRRSQRADGSWYGRWGIAFIYGTWLAVKGLSAASVPQTDNQLTRARTWLEAIQHDDGGFGESCASDAADSYRPLAESNPSQTAWGLMGLLHTSEGITPPIRRAARFLLREARATGGWRETYPTGAGVAGQAYLRYHSYADVWPLIALCHYRRRLRQRR